MDRHSFSNPYDSILLGFWIEKNPLNGLLDWLLNRPNLQYWFVWLHNWGGPGIHPRTAFSFYSSSTPLHFIQNFSTTCAVVEFNIISFSVINPPVLTTLVELRHVHFPLVTILSVNSHSQIQFFSLAVGEVAASSAKHHYPKTSTFWNGLGFIINSIIHIIDRYISFFI